MAPLRTSLAVATALLLPSAALAAAGYTLHTIALEGAPAPGTADAYGEFFDVAIDETGRIGFGAPLLSGFPAAGVWLDAGAGPELRVRNGDPAPAPLAGTFLAFGGFARLDDAGGVGLAAVLTGGVDGLFLDTGAASSALAWEGQAAPTPPGGTLAAAIADVGFFGMNGAGDVAFRSNVTGGTHARGVFVRSALGSTVLLAGNGDLVGGGPEAFATFGQPSINDAGELAFSAETTGGPASPALFVDAGAGAVAVARAGDPAPGTGGGTLADFIYPAIGAGGEVAFLANVTGGSAAGGLFVASPAVSSVVVENQVVPGAGPVATMASLPAIGGDGSVAMSLGFASGPVGGGVFVHDAGAFTPVALAGEVAPESGGARLASFGMLARNEAGHVAFVATLDDARTGVFLAMPSAQQVPLLPAPALPTVALLLAAVAAHRIGGATSSRKRAIRAK